MRINHKYTIVKILRNKEFLTTHEIDYLGMCNQLSKLNHENIKIIFAIKRKIQYNLLKKRAKKQGTQVRHVCDSKLT